MSTPSYIETCKRAAASIDVDALADMSPGKEEDVGLRYRFVRLGAIPVLGAKECHVGLKVPRNKQNGAGPTSRLVGEVAFIGMQLDFTPKLRTQVAKFMNLLNVAGSDMTAILTEDVSKGGQEPIVRAEVSPELRADLRKPFAGLDQDDQIFRVDLAEDPRVYWAGRQQMILDFTPLPLLWHPHIEDSERFTGYYHEAEEALHDMTVTIPLDSRLGQQLQQLPPHYDAPPITV